MKLPLRTGLFVGCCLVGYGLALAASSGHAEFDQRVSEVGLVYTLPAGFVDDGPNAALEKELAEKQDSKSPFVVHRIHSASGKLAAYIDIRVLRMDVTSGAASISYPIVFRSNAEQYCEMVTGSSCSVLSDMHEAAHAEYRADFGMVLDADEPKSARIEGHRRARVFAVSKPSKGIFYLTVMYDSSEEMENNSKALTRMLKFADR